MSDLDLTVQNFVIVSNAIIKVTCTWMIMKLRLKIMIVKMAYKISNLLDMTWLFFALIQFKHGFHSHCLYPGLSLKENTTKVVVACQNNVLLLWCAILNCTPP